MPFSFLHFWVVEQLLSSQKLLDFRGFENHLFSFSMTKLLTQQCLLCRFKKDYSAYFEFSICFNPEKEHKKHKLVATMFLRQHKLFGVDVFVVVEKALVIQL